MSLARERDAAYHAVADTQFQPLLYERELHDSDSKRMMELMIDSSDYLVTLYDGDAGRRQSNIFGLAPIEYEFWRFLALSYITGNGGTEVTTEIRTEIEREIERSFGTSRAPEKQSLRGTYIQECIARSGSLYESLVSRVRLFVPETVKLQHSDCEFIRFLPERCVERFTASPSWRSHQEIYRAVYRRLQSDCEDGTIKRAPNGILSADGTPLSIKIAGSTPDRSGTLLRVLEWCFEKHLNLQGLQVDPLEGTPDSVRFVMWGSPTRLLCEGEPATRVFLHQLRNGPLPLDNMEIDLVPQIEPQLLREKNLEILIRSTQIEKDRALFMIPFVDVPGALWEIVKIVSTTQLAGRSPDIITVSIFFRGEHKAVLLRIALPPGVDYTADLNFMEYKLHSAACVLGAAAHSDLTLSRGEVEVHPTT